MKKSPAITALTLALGAFALVAHAVVFRPRMPSAQRVVLSASDGEGVQGMKTWRRPSPLMLALDANHDGTIDAGEIACAPTALSALDKNCDGKLERDELEWPNPFLRKNPAIGNEYLASAASPPPLMLALDANHDGMIDAGEIADAPAELATLDKNGDGRLTARELEPTAAPPYGGFELDNDLKPNEVPSAITAATRLQLNCHPSPNRPANSL